MRILLPLIVLLLLPLHADAVGTHRWTAYGYGDQPCAKFLLAVNSTEPTHVLTYEFDTYYPERALYMEWIDGYIHGVNANTEPRSARIRTDDGIIEMWLRNYCGEHPDTPLKDAVSGFVKSQHAR